MGGAEAYVFKILLVGEGGCGKTATIDQVVNQRFMGNYQMTIGVSLVMKEMMYDGKRVTLQIWDIGGQDRFEPLRKTFYLGAKGVIIVFDLTRYITWQKVEKWNNEIIDFCGLVPRVVIGNKVDLAEEMGAVVEKNEIFDFTNEIDADYFETSAKNGTNVQAAFIALVKKLLPK